MGVGIWVGVRYRHGYLWGTVGMGIVFANNLFKKKREIIILSPVLQVNIHCSLKICVGTKLFGSPFKRKTYVLKQCPK